MVKKHMKMPHDRVEIRKRKMADYDVDLFGHRLKNIDWSIIDLLNDVDEVWDMIHKGLLFELDLLCPFNFIKVKKHRPIWFGGYLSVIAKERDLLFDRYRRSGKKNKALYNQAVQKRREFNVRVKNAKRNFSLNNWIYIEGIRSDSCLICTHC